MNKAEKAVEVFSGGFNCAQAVCSTYCRDFNVEPKLGLKIAAAFGGGICQSGELCGSLAGALMVIGLKFGKTGIDDDRAKEITYEKSRELLERFRERFGAVKCKELLGHDMSTPEGKNVIKENNLIKLNCPDYVRFTTETLEELLSNKKHL